MTIPTPIMVVILILIGCVTTIISFAYGSNGYEAFLSTSLALLILFHWQAIVLLRAVRRRYGLLRLLLLLPLVLVIWLFVFVALMLCLTYWTPQIGEVRAQVSWMLVVVGAVPYAVVRYYTATNDTVESLGFAALVTMYAAVTALFALVVYSSADSVLSSIVLIVAAECQVVISYLFIKSNFVKDVVQLSNRYVGDIPSAGRNAGLNLSVFILGSILIAPMLIIGFISAL